MANKNADFELNSKTSHEGDETSRTSHEATVFLCQSR